MHFGVHERKGAAGQRMAEEAVFRTPHPAEWADDGENAGGILRSWKGGGILSSAVPGSTFRKPQGNG